MEMEIKDQFGKLYAIMMAFQDTYLDDMSCPEKGTDNAVYAFYAMMDIADDIKQKINAGGIGSL